MGQPLVWLWHQPQSLDMSMRAVGLEGDAAVRVTLCDCVALRVVGWNYALICMYAYAIRQFDEAYCRPTDAIFILAARYRLENTICYEKSKNICTSKTAVSVNMYGTHTKE